MRLKQIDIVGFKSFAKKSSLQFSVPVTAVVGPNGSGKSNVVEAFRFVLGEQSMKSMRGKSGADLIFRGGTGSPKLSRASVSITFDNSDKVFAFQTGETTTPVLFDSVTFTRELFADGTSKYSMNGTEIRLKQMVELLASVNIGTSTHHIISQGEADGILRANARERREILEDALGLKVYHMRIRESESKLARTNEHLKEVQLLRRELAPHLSFLKKQVEKVEKAQSLRSELHDALLQFLASERAILGREEQSIHNAKEVMEKRKYDLEQTINTLPQERGSDPFSADIEHVRREMATCAQDRRQLEQRASKLEGMIEAHRTLDTRATTVHKDAVTFLPDEYTQALHELELAIRILKESNDIESAKRALEKFEAILARFASKQASEKSVDTKEIDHSAIRDIVLELEGVQKTLAQSIAKSEALEQTLRETEDKRTLHFKTLHDDTETRYKLKQSLTETTSELAVLAISEQAFIERKERYDTELKEAAFLFGPTFLHALTNGGVSETDITSDMRRSIDRLKIKLDEHAGIGNEVLKEYEDTAARDAFLSKELVDIEASTHNLEALIIDLKKVLDERFTNGVKTINERFGEFFKTMFGGGSAFLELTLEKKRKRRTEEDEELLDTGEEDEQFERGIEVHVSLPEKKVKELTMLSGGERSLVSIALLFAISQVNPPPFLVLDETDAALDEANSRRYGDMVERLSEYSQLIVVTHNRETMSRASVLYGVTLGPDSGSKLLSIKFDEAVKVAK